MNTSFRNLRRWPFATILSARKYGYDNIFAPHGAKLGSLMCMAILRGDNREVRQMIENGAPLDHQDEPDGWTPLIYSIYYDNPAGRHILLARGADPMITDFSGKTALMFAAINGDVHLTADLLTRGLSPDAVDNNGKTALDFAEEYHNRECLTLLNMLTAANRK